MLWRIKQIISRRLRPDRDFAERRRGRAGWSEVGQTERTQSGARLSALRQARVDHAVDQRARIKTLELPADVAVLSVPPEERDAARVNAVAAALAAGNVIDLPFLRSLDTEELREACKTQLRVDRLKPGDVVCLQGEEADCAYGVLAGSVSCHVRKDLQPESIYDELLKQITDETVAKAAEGPAVKGIFHVTYALADARRRASVKGASKLSKLRNRMRDDEDEETTRRTRRRRPPRRPRQKPLHQPSRPSHQASNGKSAAVIRGMVDCRTDNTSPCRPWRVSASRVRAALPADGDARRMRR